MQTNTHHAGMAMAARRRALVAAALVGACLAVIAGCRGPASGGGAVAVVASDDSIELSGRVLDEDGDGASGRFVRVTRRGATGAPGKPAPRVTVGLAETGRDGRWCLFAPRVADLRVALVGGDRGTAVAQTINTLEGPASRRVDLQLDEQVEVNGTFVTAEGGAVGLARLLGWGAVDAGPLSALSEGSTFVVCSPTDPEREPDFSPRSWPRGRLYAYDDSWEIVVPVATPGFVSLWCRGVLMGSRQVPPRVPAPAPGSRPESAPRPRGPVRGRFSVGGPRQEPAERDEVIVIHPERLPAARPHGRLDVHARDAVTGELLAGIHTTAWVPQADPALPTRDFHWRHGTPDLRAMHTNMGPTFLGVGSIRFEWPENAGLDAGPWELSVGAAGYVGAKVMVDVKPLPETTTCDVRLARPGPAIRGTVRDEAGQPVAYAKVVLVNPAGTRERTFEESWDTTGFDGSFQFLAGPTGPFKLLVWDGACGGRCCDATPLGDGEVVVVVGTQGASVYFDFEGGPLPASLRLTDARGLPACDDDLFRGRHTDPVRRIVLDPGHYTATARAPGCADLRVDFDVVVNGDGQIVRLPLARAPR